MPDNPTAYPLAWPPHKPRARVRKNGKFQARGDNGYLSPISIAKAVKRLDEELNRLGAGYVVLSTNMPTRLDGRPRSDREPDDPGAAVYFRLKDKPHTMACDAYTRLSQNIAALAAHIEATRAIERHGVATAAEVLQAFTALPAPDTVPARRPWWVVLEMGDAEPARGSVTAAVVSLLYREAARRVSANGGDLTGVNLAKEEALSWLAG